jgi:DNA-binding MarR family transcriptional regulator
MQRVSIPSVADQVSQLREEWRRERPDLDPSAMATVGRLLRVAALIGDEIDWFAQERGISRPEGDVLMTLRRVGAPHRLDPGALARSLVLTPARLSTRLDQLERQGLVQRISPEGKSGASEVQLTDKGREMVDEFLPAHVANEERLLAPLTIEERDTLDTLLGRMIEPLESRR